MINLLIIRTGNFVRWQKSYQNLGVRTIIVPKNSVNLVKTVNFPSNLAYLKTSVKVWFFPVNWFGTYSLTSRVVHLSAYCGQLFATPSQLYAHQQHICHTLRRDPQKFNQQHQSKWRQQPTEPLMGQWKLEYNILCIIMVSCSVSTLLFA